MNLLATLSILIIVRLQHSLTGDYDYKVEDDDLMVDDEDMAYYDSDGGVAVGSRHFSNGSILKNDKMNIKIIDIADYVNQDKDVTKLIMENESEETEDLDDSAPDLWIRKDHVDNKSEDFFPNQIKSSNIHININNYHSPYISNVKIPKPEGEVAYHKPGIKININNFHPTGSILENRTKEQQENMFHIIGLTAPSINNRSQRGKGDATARKDKKKNSDYSDVEHSSWIPKYQIVTEISVGPISVNKTEEKQENIFPDEDEPFITNSKREKGKTDSRKHVKKKSRPSDMKKRTRYILKINYHRS